MSRLSASNVELAKQIISRYPRPKSATIPLCHLAQEQDGYLADDAIAHIAELIGCTSAEVLGTASFYEMFKRHEVGRYCLNICTNISCQIMGGEELLEHAEQLLGVHSGGTTEDGMFTIEDVECIAACTEAPALQVNYRYFHRISPDDLEQLIADLRSGALDDVVPHHGKLGRVRQELSGDQLANVTPPEEQGEPVWIARHRVAQESAAAGGGDAS